MAENFSRYDTADYLKTEEDMILYLDACIEEDPGDGSLIRTALGSIARARGMSQLARDTGISREGTAPTTYPAIPRKRSAVAESTATGEKPWTLRLRAG